ncbi:hypothetical protein GWI33_009922, partial [Rhynchophorus ferrugineus]
NTLTLKDLSPEQSANGNSLLSMVINVCMSMGVALVGVLLHYFEKIGSQHSNLWSFYNTYVVLGVITIFASLVFRRLRTLKDKQDSSTPPLEEAGVIYFVEHDMNAQDFSKYPVQGIDISHHQGDIDWSKVAAQPLQFVFIKATEGGDYQDPKFVENWYKAQQQGLVVGAYHFYRNCKSGSEQAQNYINTVPKTRNSLPPVMDVEFQWTCPEVTAEQLQQQIAIMAKRLEQYYGKKPILYTTPNYYKNYIAGYLDDYPLWLQDLKNPPPRFDSRPWILWQYSHTGKVAGIATEVDRNVFRGDANALKKLVSSTVSRVD